MHGAKSSLGQVWVQLYLLVLGAFFFAWVDLRYARRKKAAASVISTIEVSVNSVGR